MKIIDRSQDRLILYCKHWFVFLFLGFWICAALLVAFFILWQEWPQLWPASIAVSLPLIGFVSILFPWREITARFDRLSNEITVERRRLLGARRETYKLSDLRKITCDTGIDDNDATVTFDFGLNSKSLELPVLPNRFFKPHNSTVEALVVDLRAWSGITT